MVEINIDQNGGAKMSQSFSQNTFEFEGRSYMPMLIILAGIFLMAITVYGGVGFGLSAGSFISMGVIFLVIIFVIYFRVGQMSSDLVLSDSGISRFLFSVKWRELRWHEVKQIRTVRQNSPGDYKLALFMFVYSYDRTKGWNPFKPAVVFTDRTKDRKELEVMLNHYIKEYGIRVFEKMKIGNGKKQWRKTDSLHLKKETI